jgi:HEAT repeat protein
VTKGRIVRRSDGFRLNEPRTPIVGGKRRPSLLLKNARFAAIRERERLNRVLIVHDPGDSRSMFGLRDRPILRLAAREGVLANQVPAIRRNAMLALAESPSPENLGLLSDLALIGEDFYTRGHAMLALGHSGLKSAAPLLVKGLGAKELFERNAAEAGLVALGRKNGLGFLDALCKTERQTETQKALQRILAKLKEQRSASPKKHISSRKKGS